MIFIFRVIHVEKLWTFNSETTLFEYFFPLFSFILTSCESSFLLSKTHHTINEMTVTPSRRPFSLLSNSKRTRKHFHWYNMRIISLFVFSRRKYVFLSRSLCGMSWSLGRIFSRLKESLLFSTHFRRERRGRIPEFRVGALSLISNIFPSEKENNPD